MHEDYDRLRPQTVLLPAVENRTVYPLREVRFGGAIQRSLFGARPHDILFLLRSSLDEVLAEKGYRVTVPRQTSDGDSSSAAPTPAEQADAVLTCTVESWNAGTGSLPYMTLRYRVELHGGAGRLRTRSVE